MRLLWLRGISDKTLTGQGLTSRNLLGRRSSLLRSRLSSRLLRRSLGSSRSLCRCFGRSLLGSRGFSGSLGSCLGSERLLGGGFGDSLCWFGSSRLGRGRSGLLCGGLGCGLGWGSVLLVRGGLLLCFSYLASVSPGSADLGSKLHSATDTLGQVKVTLLRPSLDRAVQVGNIGGGAHVDLVFIGEESASGQLTKLTMSG